MTDVPIRFLRKTVAPEKVLKIIEQRECDHSQEKISRYPYIDAWGDLEYLFLCECGASFEQDPNDEIDLDEVSPEFEAEIKQVCPR